MPPTALACSVSCLFQALTWVGITQGQTTFSLVFSCYDELTGNGHSVYLWESQARAEEFFSPAFTQHFREVFGVEPTVSHLDILVLVDNRAGGDVVAN